MLETTQIKQRLPFIDLIRGITIIEMISYHFLWDLVYLYTNFASEEIVKGRISFCGRYIGVVSVDGLVDEPSTKSEEKTAEVDGQNRLYEILERELQAKNL